MQSLTYDMVYIFFMETDNYLIRIMWTSIEVYVPCKHMHGP